MSGRKGVTMAVAGLFNDIDYLELRARLGSPNIFMCLKNASHEIRHSNFIAWLLNPEETHQQKDYFLRKFLLAVGEVPPSEGERFTVCREEGGIDILLLTTSRALVIENKIFAKDSTGQLSKYREKVERKYPKHQIRLIYWTLGGESPIDKAEDKHWGRYSHEEFNKILKSSLGDIKDQRVSVYVEDYCEAVSRELLKNPLLSVTAKTIIDRHKSILGEIFSATDDYDLQDQVAIDFLKVNSSFVKGNGFFSPDRHFLKAFERACIENDCFVFARGAKQSTYFSFCPKNIVVKLSENERCFSFTFRFFEKTRVLYLSFGLSLETDANRNIRTHLYENIDKIQCLPGVQIVKRPGNKYIGIVNKKINFNPLEIESQNIETVIGLIFETELKNFVWPVADALKEILEEFV